MRTTRTPTLTVPLGPLVIDVSGARRVDRPGPRRRRRVDVARRRPSRAPRRCASRRARPEYGLRRRARRVRAAVELALERRARLGRGELNEADVALTVPLGPLVIVVSSGTGWVPPMASRTVRTTVPLADRAASQSEQRRQRARPHPALATGAPTRRPPWKTSGTQPPRELGLRHRALDRAQRDLAVPEGRRPHQERILGRQRLGLRRPAACGHQFGDTIPPTRRPVW